jgi:hypothetical protein
VRFRHAGSRPDQGTPARWGPSRSSFRYHRWAGAAALVGACALVGPAALAATGWTVQTIPQTGNNAELNAAFARTNTDAWAVGQQFGAAGQTPPAPVAYHWNGTTWSLVITPSLGMNASLAGVSASTASDAWAVGFSVLGHHEDSTLLEHWNGTTWSVDSAAAVTGYAAHLNSVADLSPTNAWAAGEGPTGTLLEHWNGTAWSQVSLPDPAFTPGSTQSLSATSASDIWLAGTSINTATDATVAEALHFDGTAWSVVPMQQPGTNTPTISAVTDLSATNAWAVGEDSGATSAIGGSTLIEHWNGSTWSIVPSPTPGADPGLTGVAARGPGDVYAVGSNLPSINGGTVHGMILRWNGTAWSVDTDPTTGSYSPLYAAATLPGATNEWAVGTLSNTSLILSHG